MKYIATIQEQYNKAGLMRIVVCGEYRWKLTGRSGAYKMTALNNNYNVRNLRNLKDVMKAAERLQGEATLYLTAADLLHK